MTRAQLIRWALSLKGATVLTALGTIVTALGTLALALFGLRQVRLAREQSTATEKQLALAKFSVGFDALLRLEAQFNSPDMRAVRRAAAEKLLQGKARVVGSKGEPTVDRVLDLFDTAGYLVNQKVLETHAVYHMFYDPLIHYWYAAKKYVSEVDEAEPRGVWKDIARLVPMLLALRAADEGTGTRIEDVEPEEEDWRAFLEEECGGVR